MVINQTCKKCTSEFVITEQEQEFYVKKGFPNPTNCPVCRKKEREKYIFTPFYQDAKCDSCNEQILVFYKDIEGRKVYCEKCYEDVEKCPTEIEYEPGRFLEQYKDLISKLPIRGVMPYENHDHSENQINSHEISFCKNSVESFDLSKCMNSVSITHAIGSVNSVDCIFIFGKSVDSSSNLVSCNSSSNCHHCSYCHRCANCYYSDNCVNCQDCFGCSGLRNKQYYIYNKKYTESEYKEQIATILKANNDDVLAEVHQNLKNIPVPASYEVGNNVDSLYGFSLENCESCFHSFYTRYSTKSGYTWQSESLLECWDMSVTRKTEFGYMCGDCSYSNNIAYGSDLYECNDCLYCYKLYKCDSCIGSVGIKEKKYHILNKEYTESEYLKLSKIIANEVFS